MADLRTINIGNLANDGLGDDLRTAFDKVNDNFNDLNDELTVNVVNVGPFVSGLFKEKVGNELRFKSSDAGRKITFNNNTDSITINSTVPDSFTRFDTDSGIMTAQVAEQISEAGGTLKSPIFDNRWDCRELLAEDPNGYKFAFYQA